MNSPRKTKPTCLNNICMYLFAYVFLGVTFRFLFAPYIQVCGSYALTLLSHEPLISHNWHSWDHLHILQYYYFIIFTCKSFFVVIVCVLCVPDVCLLFVVLLFRLYMNHKANTKKIKCIFILVLLLDYFSTRQTKSLQDRRC